MSVLKSRWKSPHEASAHKTRVYWMIRGSPSAMSCLSAPLKVLRGFSGFPRQFPITTDFILELCGLLSQSKLAVDETYGEMHAKAPELALFLEELDSRAEVAPAVALRRSA